MEKKNMKWAVSVGPTEHRGSGGGCSHWANWMLGLARPVGGPPGARQEQHEHCPSRSTETEQKLAGGSSGRRQGRHYVDSEGDAGTGWSLGSRLRPDPARRGTDQIPKLQDMPQGHDGATSCSRRRQQRCRETAKANLAREATCGALCHACRCVGGGQDGEVAERDRIRQPAP